MSDYSQVNDYSAKDSLASGNPSKLILGSDIDAEFAAISTAIASKYDSTDLATQVQAELETNNTVLMTPLRLAQWADYNAGVVGDLQALADPNADTVLGWDDSAGASIAFTLSGALDTSGTALRVTAANILTQLLTVDGAGSGLDADLLDGNSSAAFATASHTHAGTDIISDINDAQLSANVPLLNAANAFTAAQSITTTASQSLLINSTHADGSRENWQRNGTFYGLLGNSKAVSGGTLDNMELYAAATLVLTGATAITLNGVAATDYARLSQSNTFTGTTQTVSGTNALLVTTDGAISGRLLANASGSQVIIGASSNHKLVFIANNSAFLEIGTTGNFDFKAGTVTTNNASASEVGYKGVPYNQQNGDYPIDLTDAGKCIVKDTGASGETITIPANGSVPFPLGTVITIINAGGGTLQIAITSDNLILAGAGTTGTRTLANNGVATIVKFLSTYWMITGTGLS